MIDRIKLSNFYQHGDLEVSLSPGVTLFKGENGSGKSHVVSSLCFALSGEIPGEAKLADAVKWGEATGGVEARLTTGYIIRRTLSGSHELEAPDGSRITGKAAVNDEVAKLLGIDAKLVKDVLVIRQGELASFVTMRRADRLELVNKMLGLDKAVTIRRAVASMESSVAVPLDKSVEIETLEKDIRECAYNAESLEKERVELYKSLEDMKGTKEALERTIMSPTEESLVTESRRLSDELAGVKGTLADIEYRVNLLPEAPPVISKEEEEMASLHADMLRDEGRLKEITERLLSLKPKEPGPEPSGAKLDALRESEKTLKAKVEDAEEGVCSRCGQSLNVSSADMGLVEDELYGVQLELKRVEEEYVKARTKWSDRRFKYEADKAEVDRAEEEQKKLESKIAIRKQVLEGFDIEAHNEKIAAITAYSVSSGERERLVAERAASKSLIETLADKLRTLEEARDTAPREEDVALARKNLEALETLSNGYTDMVAKVAAAKASLEQMRSSLEGLKRDAEARASSMDSLDILTGVKKVYSKDGAPKLAARASLDAVNALTAAYLSLFDAPFEARLGMDMEFECSFDSKEWKAPTALSGGQKVVAGLSVRLALLEALAGGAGLLVLDEPTAYLDEANRELLAGVLGKVAEKAREGGFRVVVPTHDPCLDSVGAAIKIGG